MVGRTRSGEGLDASGSLRMTAMSTWVARQTDVTRTALDFLRIADGMLADAETTIDELYAWGFDHLLCPFLRDFADRKSMGSRRDAGAIEKTD